MRIYNETMDNLIGFTIIILPTLAFYLGVYIGSKTK